MQWIESTRLFREVGPSNFFSLTTFLTSGSFKIIFKLTHFFCFLNKVSLAFFSVTVFSPPPLKWTLIVLHSFARSWTKFVLVKNLADVSIHLRELPLSFSWLDWAKVVNSDDYSVKMLIHSVRTTTRVVKNRSFSNPTVFLLCSKQLFRTVFWIMFPYKDLAGMRHYNFSTFHTLNIFNIFLWYLLVFRIFRNFHDIFFMNCRFH